MPWASPGFQRTQLDRARGRANGLDPAKTLLWHLFAGAAYHLLISVRCQESKAKRGTEGTSGQGHDVSRPRSYQGPLAGRAPPWQPCPDTGFPEAYAHFSPCRCDRCSSHPVESLGSLNFKLELARRDTRVVANSTDERPPIDAHCSHRTAPGDRREERGGGGRETLCRSSALPVLSLLRILMSVAGDECRGRRETGEAGGIEREAASPRGASPSAGRKLKRNLGQG